MVFKADYFFSEAAAAGSPRLASQSRELGVPLRSVSTLPLMESAVTFPLYLEVTELPLNSRVTLKEISSPFNLPSEISVSVPALPPRPGAVMVPVTLSPSAFNFIVITRSGPPLRPGVLQV
ncbi:MAG: hypothetical protein JWR26_2092 [Pedosphaera sp.]|nr:hypothetical protein [Pedosphaera sp.]